MSETKHTGGDIGFTGALLIALIVLKLTGTIAWSWWWVLSPAWIGVGVGLAALLVGMLVVIAKERREARAELERRAEKATRRHGRAALVAGDRVRRGDLVYEDGTGRVVAAPERWRVPFGVALSGGRAGQTVEVAFDPPSLPTAGRWPS